MYTPTMILKLLGVVACLLPAALAQESPNQNQSNTLIEKLIYLPLYTGNGTSNQTFCDAYTPANETQYTFITKLIERAFTGNYKPLANTSSYQGTGLLDPNAFYRDPIGITDKVNLLPYFNGALKSTNRDGVATSVKFFEGANGTCSINGENILAPTLDGRRLIAHIAQYMGVILGCDSKHFPKYKGNASQAQVHRFMALTSVEIHYFIHNIYDSALTSGVTQPDGIIIGTALDNMFNKACSPPKVIAPYQPAELQNMCYDSTCAPWALGNATCSAYNQTGFGVPPANATTNNHPTAVAYCGRNSNWYRPTGGPKQYERSNASEHPKIASSWQS